MTKKKSDFKTPLLPKQEGAKLQDEKLTDEYQLTKVMEWLMPWMEKTDGEQTIGDWQDTLTTKMMVKLLELWLTEENCEQLQQLLQFYHPVDRAAMVYALLTYMMTGHEMTFKSAMANHHYKLMQKAIRQDVSEVKKCCASCEHKGIGADGSRKCILTFLRVDSDFCCELWKISHNLKKVRVKF